MLAAEEATLCCSRELASAGPKQQLIMLMERTGWAKARDMWAAVITFQCQLLFSTSVLRV